MTIPVPSNNVHRNRPVARFSVTRWFAAVALLFISSFSYALQATKSTSAVTHVGNNVFEVTFTLDITNENATPEYFDIQATDVLTVEFGGPVATFPDVDSPGEYFIDNIAVDTSGVVNGGNTNFVADTSFDGAVNNTLFVVAGNSGSLQPNDTVSVSFRMRFLPVFNSSPYTNEFTAAADLVRNFTADNTETDLSNTVPLNMVGALTPLACTSDFYIGSATNFLDPTQLFDLDPLAATLTPIGGVAHALPRNASGYRVSDGLIYSIQTENNNLMVTDANGTTVVLGDVPTLPDPVNPGFYSAGEVIGNTLYVTGSNTLDDTELWAVNVTTLTATLVGTDASITSIGDLAHNPLDGQLYYASNGDFYRLDPTNANATLIASNIGIGPTTFGAAFMDNEGNFYGYLNNGDVWIVDSTTGAASQLPNSGPTVSFFDGASCPNANPPFNIEIGAAKENVTLVDNGTNFTVTYRLRIENSGDVELFDVQATDDLAAIFGAPQAVIGDVDAAGEYFVAVNTIDTSGIVNGGNTGYSASGFFNGSGANTGILDAAQPGSLAGGDVVIIELAVTFVPSSALAPFDNQFTAAGDVSQDGTADLQFTDLSTNGTDPDQNGAIPGNDGDGNPNNTDSGTPLGLPDTDNDTVPDVFDVDDDNDGIPDATEGAGDPDTDTFPNSLDIDSDGDGIPDNIEAQAEGAYRAPQGVDTDLDGLDNEYDTDNGGTAIVIANTDTQDNPDYLDDDSDNDTIPDLIEGHDADMDGVADVSPAPGDADSDGLDDNFDTVAGFGPGNAIGSNAPLQNSDGQDNRDWRDTDDDNDTVLTATEGGVGNDADGDGTPDYLDADDVDMDGVPDSVDIDNDNDGIPDATEGAGNSDGDALPDRLDIDSDNDGIPDNVEAQAEGAYRAPQGVDTDLDGLDDEYDTDNGGTAITIANTDGQDNPDYLDDDSDNDTVPDAIEGHDANRDGVADNTPVPADADNDGLDDAFDTTAVGPGNSTGSNAALQNTDGADNRDWRDLDDDNDSVDTNLEDTNLNGDPTDDDADGDGVPNYIDMDALTDTDGDGVPDNVDGDSDGDGVLDIDEGNGTDPSADADSDGVPNFRDSDFAGFVDSNGDNVNDNFDADLDGVANHLDADSDGDGIPDNTEAQATPPVLPTGVDSDNDGIDNAYDGSPITPVNSDGADTPDFLDADSDNDGVPDSIEGHDADMDGVADNVPVGNDADNDGLDDAYDTVAGPAPNNAQGSNAATQNTDGADNPDWRDSDDDEDGTPTSAEDANADTNFANDDVDNDGTPDYLDAVTDIASLSGTVFLDRNSDGNFDGGDTALENWTVEVVLNDMVVASQQVAADGSYAFADLLPGTGYQVRIRHPDSFATFEVLDGITLGPGQNLLNQNLPIDPSGVVYDTDLRTPIPGVTVTTTDGNGAPLPAACVLPGQQDQVTGPDGRYKVDLVPGGDAVCPSGVTIGLTFTAPAGFVSGVSTTIPPQPGALDPTGQPSPLLVQPQDTAPQQGDDTTYFLQFTLEAGDPDVIHNHVPLDPVGAFDVRLTKSTNRRTVSVGDLVPYTIEVQNVGARPIIGLTVTDTLPGGFRLVDGSVRVSPDMANLSVTGERPVLIGGIDVGIGASATISYVLRVGAGVAQGEYVNTATASLGTAPLGNVAQARVEVVSDPDFEQTSIIGKVFDDRDGDGWQDDGEPGVPGVRLATVTGLLIETDRFGRYHIAGVDVKRFERGQNFYLKLDPSTLPEGSEMVSENPRVMRITQGLMNQINFAVRLPQTQSVEAVEIGEVFFAPGSANVKQQYLALLDDMAARIQSYEGGTINILARAGSEALAAERAGVLRASLAQRLGAQAPSYVIQVMSEVFDGPMMSSTGSTTTISEEIFFDTAKHDIKPEFVPVIEALAAQIRAACAGEVVIEGHADPRGNVAYNQALSERRSQAVRQALQAGGAFDKQTPDCKAHPAADEARASEPGVPANSHDVGIHQRSQEGDSVVNGLAKKALIGLLNFIAPVAYADTAEPCALNYCATDEGVVVRILNRGEENPRSSGDSENALQDNRRVSVRGEVQGAGSANPEADRAEVSGSMRVSLADGSALWLTEDPLVSAPQLAFAVPVDSTTSELAFPFYNNYAQFQERLELTIMRGSDLDRARPLAVLTGEPRYLGEFRWKPEGVQPGDTVRVVMRAYGAGGNFDETRVQSFVILDPRDLGADEKMQLAEAAATPHATVYGRSDLAIQNIPLVASRVRLHGDVRGDQPSVVINGDSIPTDGANRFAVEYLLPVGEHNFDVQVARNGSAPVQRQLSTEVTGRYMFLAALADLTASDNELSGSIEALGDDDRYDDDFHVDGRLAFYLKGKIKGKYLITAHLDTREDEIDDIFDDVFDKDPDALFRRLDPDRYYPVYGDDSTTTSDVDTLGRMYVRVDWDQSQVLWGNYNTSITGNEFIQYNRSLYGAMLNYNSVATTELGEAKTQGKAFVSETQTAFGHAEFVGTGGSLYYLPHTDILPGSEKITLEYRDRDSNRVVEELRLYRGQDYEVDEIQGRIILSRPLLQFRSRDNSIIRNNPLDGDDAVLLVDYEYLPNNFDADHVTGGLRGKKWLGDHFAVGATYVDEGRGLEDYRMGGVDVTIQPARGTYLKVEIAKTDNSQANGFFSDNGGLTFAGRSSTNTLRRHGDAWGFEGRVNFQELGLSEEDWTFGAWWRDTDRDFSVARRDTGIDMQEYGLELYGEFSDRFNMLARTSVVKRGTFTEDVLSMLLSYDLTAKDRVRLEVERRDQSDSFTNVDLEETVAAVELAHAFNDGWEIYGGAQSTVAEDAAARNNDMLFVGSRNRISDKLLLETEVTHGHRGKGLTVGVDYARNDRHTLYGSFTHSTDATIAPDGGQRITVGNRYRVSNQTSLFTENQFVHEPTAAGFTHAYGLDYAPAPGWTMGLSVQKGELDALSGLVDRKSMSANAGYRNEVIQWRSVVEVRRDDGSERRDQVLTTNRADLRMSDSVRLLGKLNLSKTNDSNITVADAEFTEGSIGIAYRPTSNDRLNVLAKYTYLYDLGSFGQDGGANTDQESVISSIEAMYRLNPKWKVGAKYGHRRSKLRANRDSGQWFRSTVDFSAVRVRYHLVKKWEAVAEYRHLEVKQDSSERDGFLIGVDRHMNDNVKLGFGYSFADFSDDLRIVDYDTKGFYFNFVGKI